MRQDWEGLAFLQPGSTGSSAFLCHTTEVVYPCHDKGIASTKLSPGRLPLSWPPFPVMEEAQADEQTPPEKVTYVTQVGQDEAACKAMMVKVAISELKMQSCKPAWTPTEWDPEVVLFFWRWYQFWGDLKINLHFNHITIESSKREHLKLSSIWD